ncbi:uncharacterized protein LOC129581960 isoform X2 [Paramacrobiotus metropolitanus]|uniref:uncharacterized protein LOC129581960 isoform X2 n=1 Tax=Paramacrobiotus metropolitanus TaxID=2943436 RepID=UPI00244608E6|nr:uncharacterized protein LOC129581960 isoform X2 [Paramacrobiotus metropolitanus]
MGESFLNRITIMLIKSSVTVIFCAFFASTAIATVVKKDKMDTSTDAHHARRAYDYFYQRLSAMRNATDRGPPVPPPPSSILHSTLVEQNEPQNRNTSRSIEIHRPVLTAHHRDGSGGNHMQIIQSGNNNNMAALLPLLLMNNGGGNGRQDGNGGNNNAALISMMMSMMTQHNTQQIQYYGGHSDR